MCLNRLLFSFPKLVGGNFYSPPEPFVLQINSGLSSPHSGSRRLAHSIGEPAHTFFRRIKIPSYNLPQAKSSFSVMWRNLLSRICNGNGKCVRRRSEGYSIRHSSLYPERFRNITEKELEPMDWFDEEIYSSTSTDFHARRPVAYSNHNVSVSSGELF